MKRIGILVLVLGVTLLAASFAFADNGGGKSGKGEKAEKADKPEKAEKQGKCQNVSLKGTAPATTFTVTVDKANKAGRDLKTATVTFSGKVSINAQLCSDAAGASAASESGLKLRNLKVAKAASEADDDD